MSAVDWTGIGTFLIGIASIGTLIWTVYQQRDINKLKRGRNVGRDQGK